MNDERGNLYLFTGLILGLVLGVLWGWYVAPVRYTDTEPVTLNPTAKDEYRILIALAYSYNQDAARSQSRLALLDDPDPMTSLASLAQRANANGRPQNEIHAISQLAIVAVAPPANIPTAVPLTVYPTLTPLSPATATPVPESSTEAAVDPTQSPSQAPDLPTATPAASVTLRPTTTITPTASPFPTPTPTATAGSPFILESRILSCPSTNATPKLVIQTFDRSGNGVPGVEIILNWPDHEEHIFTGLKPELGLGFADFQMTTGNRYTLRLADGSQLITDIQPEQCDPGNGQFTWGTLELTFIQP